MPNEILYGRLGRNAVHICVDMQRMFAEKTDWCTPWMERVRPVVERIAVQHPADTIFTRFIPAAHPGEGHGTWKRYYERWASMTIESIGPATIELVPELARLVPPAGVLDKRFYSPWLDDRLQSWLSARGANTLIVSGGETDVCVLATVLGAVDRGYRVVVVTDALCSSSDAAHDASLAVYRTRYGQQVETAEAGLVLDAWR